MNALVQELLSDDQAAQSLLRRAGANADASGQAGDAAAANGGATAAAPAAVVVPGLAGVHFNSTTARPARSLKGRKKGGAQSVVGQAPPGAKNVLVWLRQVRVDGWTATPWEPYAAPATLPLLAVVGTKCGWPAHPQLVPAQDLRLHDNPALFEAARFAKLVGGTVTLVRDGGLGFWGSG